MDPIEMTRKGAQELSQLLQVLQFLHSIPDARVLLSVSRAEPQDGEMGFMPTWHCPVSRTHLIQLLTDEENHIGRTLARVLAQEYPQKD